MSNNVDYTFQHRLWAKEYTKVYQDEGREAAGMYLVKHVPKAFWGKIRKYIEKEFEKRGMISQRQVNPHLNDQDDPSGA